jgi:hypothetical protein
MIRPWADLNPRDRETFRTIVAFIDNRLAEQGTIDWALKLKSGQWVERMAVEDLLSGPRAHDIAEPWASAWRLIEESWLERPLSERSITARYDIQRRLQAGDRSGSVITAIVDLVAPRLKVGLINTWRWTLIKKPRKPKAVEHILSAGLTSGDLVDLNVLKLADVNDVAFLASLADALEAAVNYGLDTARRLGWDGQKRLWQLGDLGRAYYVADTPRVPDGGDPDAYHHGIAPSVKLLHSIVARISELDLAAAQKISQRWRLDKSPIYIRLWAAVSRNLQITPACEVSEFLSALSQDRFWDVHGFPEIAELRAIRFRDMNAGMQDAITTRIQKGPPRNHWPKKADAEKVENARLFWTLRELRRIEIGGGILPSRAKAWLHAQAAQFPEILGMTIDEGFLGGVTITSREMKPDAKLDTVSDIERLKALEVALGTERRGWDDDPAEYANDWVNQEGNPEKIVADFEATNNGGDEFPNVWNRFGWAHRPYHHDGSADQDAKLGGEACRVLSLLNELSDTTLSSAIEGICAWLDSWEKYVAKLPLAFQIWLRLWPIAVEVTNAQPESENNEDLSVTARSEADDRESMDLDTLNTPAGKLIGMFLAACPSQSPNSTAFSEGSVERRMRDIIIAAEGRSGLIAKHRMIEALPYFLLADPAWVQEHLIAPLLRDDGAALALWRAVARRTRFTDVLEIIGGAMAERANDRRLGRETRRGLVFSLVIESLHAFREGRAPAVPNQRIQQMLRTLDDEVRASAANTIQQFISELSIDTAISAPKGGDKRKDRATAAVLFRSSATPFLRNVWPQERSLATPGVSSALADLPATSGEAFAEAVDTIARFLVPFDCWSMVNYGLYGEAGQRKKIASIDNREKAEALLKLLDLTVGTSEGAIIPHDLTDALDQILTVDPEYYANSIFRRLAAAARR